MNNRLCALGMSVILLGVWADSSSANFGPLQTKRERQPHVVAAPEPSREMTYQRIYESFLKENYGQVDRFAEAYLADANSGTGSWRADVLSLQALSLLKLNRPQDARRKWADLEQASADDNVRAAASASIGDSYDEEGNGPAACRAYEETLQKYPYTDQRSYCLAKISAWRAKCEPSTAKESVFFTVQVGAFSKAKNAQRLIQKLQGRHFDAYLENDGAQRRFRVRVGKLASRQEALALELRLRAEGYPTKIYP